MSAGDDLEAIDVKGSRMGIERLQSNVVLTAIIVLALIVRVSWEMNHSLVIGNEGGEYATIAENLIEGKGYLGQGLTGKPQLMFPPLYPIGIAMVSFFAPTTEIAGRIVSIMMGLLLLITINRLATHIYNARVGLISAALVALHPLLVRSSVEVQTEATFSALLILATFLSIRSIDSGTTKHFVLAGVAYGLAYLTRPEAMVFILIFPTYALLNACMNRLALKPSAIKVCTFIASFVLIASPYIFYLQHHIGQLRFEGKSAVNYRVGQQMMAGATLGQAAYGIDDSLNEIGVYTGSVNDVIKANDISLSGLLPYLTHSARHQLKEIIGAVVNNKLFGGPLLFTLVVTGLLRSAWDASRATRELYLILTVCALSVSLLSVHFFMSRYAYVFLPFLLLWGAKGVEEIATWAADSQQLISQRRTKIIPGFQSSVRVTLVSGLLLLAAWPNWHAACDDFGGTPVSCANTKKAGLWLKEQASDGLTIMDAGSAIPYYARAEYVALPDSQSVTAIRYINKKRPDYIVLRGLLRNDRSYMGEWLEKGVPDSHATLVYEIGDAIEDKIQIYKWTFD